MDLVNRPMLEELITAKGENFVSLYIPTHRYGREQQQDPVRFGNLYAEMKKQLKTRGMRKAEREAFLEGIDRLQSSEAFWQHQSDGLAVFITDDILRVYRVPIPFKSQLFVGDHFQIDALLPALSKGQHFYILALSQGEIRLFQGNRYQIAEMDLEDIPTTIEEALWPDESERQLQFHSESHSPGSEGKNASGYHGHATLDESQKTDIKRFFHQVDAGIMDILAEKNAPLILSGVKYLLPIYREISEYPNITDRVIEGNPEEKSGKTLHKEAWEIIEPIFNKERQEALKRSQMLLGSESGLISTDLTAIIPAAFYGRIDTLFIPEQKQIWGLLNKKNKSFSLHKKFKTGDVDLLNLCALQTLINSGDVYILEPSEMPNGANIIAIFRYATDAGEEA